MTIHAIITDCLLGAAVALALASSLGLLFMRDAYERLHFSSPVVTLSMPMICIAIFMNETDTQARIKAVAITVLLIFMNAIVSHSTARAFRIREQGMWDTDLHKDSSPDKSQEVA